MPGTAEQFGLCWSCQKRITARTAVWLDENEIIPCCKTCWKQISPGRRLEIALRFHDRSTAGLGVEETLAAIRDLIANSIAGYFHRFDDPENRIN